MDKKLFELLKHYMNIAYEQKMLKNDYSYNNKFSVFMAVADQYKKENFHSDLLKVILNPKTTEIGNPKHLQNFLEIIGLGKNAFGNESSIKKYVQVEREEHRVDLLIKYNAPKSKRAIIVENKINNADDQDNQLARYYERLKDEGYEVLSIPYITKFGGKVPDYNSWDKSYKEYSKIIFNEKNPLFFDLPITGADNSILNFLKTCKKQYDVSNQLGFIFLDQYELLLRKIVEDTEVTKEDEKNIQQLFEDNQKSQIQALLESWEKRGECAYNFIVANPANRNIKEKTVHGSKCLAIEKNNKYFEGVYLYQCEASIQIGFYREQDDWSDKLYKEAEYYLKKICKEHLETEIDSSWIYIYKNWYCVCIGIDNFKTFSEINTSFSNALIELSKFKS